MDKDEDDKKNTQFSTYLICISIDLNLGCLGCEYAVLKLGKCFALPTLAIGMVLFASAVACTDVSPFVCLDARI